MSIIIAGAGLAGLSAAITLAQAGRKCILVSAQPSERAQSVLAEGGINAALDNMGENDSVQEHFEDTVKGGVYIANRRAVKGLTDNAPKTVMWLSSLGVPFNRENGRLLQRPFGGQKKRRTAFAKSSTGKMIMTSLIDKARSFESEGLIKRYPHHEFLRLINDNGICKGMRIKDRISGKCASVYGTVLLACGGMNGMFPGHTTGTVHNTGDAAAAVFMQGAAFSSLEMIQYHPTTIGIPGKRCLVTEAARGEGGRLFVKRDNEPWCFMEEKYPVLKNLMPRDVVAREMFFARRETGSEVMLDMTGIPHKVWCERLPDLKKELMSYTGLDPEKEPINVHEGIHYFMGGILTNEHHRTSIENLYAAGEFTSLYHGANRLGGNSMLGAVYGGITAAEGILSLPQSSECDVVFEDAPSDEPYYEESRARFNDALCEILLDGMGIVRNEQQLDKALSALEELTPKNDREKARVMLARAALMSAAERKESRGAHYREDYPQTDDEYKKLSVARTDGGRVHISFIDADKEDICR